MEDINLIEKLTKEIGSKYMLRIERWKDEYKHWRAGLDWYGENDYTFICEKPTLEECLLLIKEFIDKEYETTRK